MEKSASFRHVECTYDSDWVTITQCMLQRLTELDGGDAWEKLVRLCEGWFLAWGVENEEGKQLIHVYSVYSNTTILTYAWDGQLDNGKQSQTADTSESSILIHTLPVLPMHLMMTGISNSFVTAYVACLTDVCIISSITHINRMCLLCHTVYYFVLWQSFSIQPSCTKVTFASISVCRIFL